MGRQEKSGIEQNANDIENKIYNLSCCCVYKKAATQTPAQSFHLHYIYFNLHV